MSILLQISVLVVKILTLPLLVVDQLGFGRFYKRVFPAIMYKLSFSYNSKMDEKKRELFRELQRFSPRGGGPLRLLEVGCGSGANFQHYPTGTRVTCTDPNPHFQNYLQKSMDKNDHLVYEKFVVASGEDLRVVEDNSVDVVVCTLVMCSCQNTPKVIREAKRVLRPGGAFFFLEHVSADPSTWTYFLQHVFQPLMYYFLDGCDPTRATWKHLEAAGFSDLQFCHFRAPFAAVFSPHIVGYAVK
ncbi:putative methyltransferase-like protein 7A [Astyanax mexicanus]|uniref:putative methyltransferase-like protein 7A n=1 Tax=Astyanax mexicanus TaxID=7994 RepID=UPI0020CB4388|nr:putative methyltransferase-like protein 7A [Astyanax mexicanus]